MWLTVFLSWSWPLIYSNNLNSFHDAATSGITVKQPISVLKVTFNAAPSLHPIKLRVTHVSFLPGNINHKVVPMSSLLDAAHCSQNAEWSVGFPGAVCDHTVNFHRLAFNNPTPTSLKAKDVILTNSHGIKIHSLCTFNGSTSLKKQQPICNLHWPLVAISENCSRSTFMHLSSFHFPLRKWFDTSFLEF